MISEKLKELEAARAKLAALEKAAAAEMNKRLAALPGEFNFDDVESFIAAVRAATGSKRGRPAGAAKSTGKRGGPGVKRRRRAVITDDTRAAVKKHVEEGKTGAQIAKALRISLPSVQNIKKALGLVKPKGR